MQSRKTYLIGEIGQNHNGSVDIAKQIVDLAAAPVREELFGYPLKSMDAVKLTKRDLNFELSASALRAPYSSPHSFGKTYGEHRKALELSNEQHFEIYKYVKSKYLDFIETLCAPSCLSILKYFSPDKLKVASRDLTNLPLIKALAETRIPIILSTGMGGKQELDEALEEITKVHSEISILHCVSEYPTRPEHVNLNSIQFLRKNYSAFSIGYSDHTIGISIPVAATAMGAEIIEKHITIDRSMKGTDQAGSLGKDGIKRLIRDIRLLEMSFGKEEIFMEPAVQETRIKLERSIATNKDLEIGQIITDSDIHLLSPGNGFKWSQREEIIGHKVTKRLEKNEIIFSEILGKKFEESKDAKK